MISKSNKLNYRTNLNRNKFRTSVSPSYKFLSNNHKKENMNYSNINLNKSYEKFSSKQLNNNSSSKSNISRKTVQNYISSKKKSTSISNNKHNYNYSFSINQNIINNPKKINDNKTKFISFKKSIHRPQKSLHLNTDLSISRNSNLNYIITEDNTKKENKENIKSDFLAKFMSKKQNKSYSKIDYSKTNDLPTKVNNDSNEEFVIENNEESNIIYNKTKSNNELANIFNELESKLTIKLSENKTNNKIKNYSILQNIFEETIQVFPENNQHLLKVLLKGYNDLLNYYISENKNLKDENESIKYKLNILEKESSQQQKSLKEKEKQIEEIKKKTIYKSQEEVSNSTKGSSFNPSSHDKEIISLNKKRNSFQQEKQQHILELNKKNIKDLDALYFYDKIIMNTEEKKGPLKDNNGDIIPKLDLDFEKRYKQEQDKIKKVFATKVHHNKSHSNSSFIQKAALSFNLK